MEKNIICKTTEGDGIFVIQLSHRSTFETRWKAILEKNGHQTLGDLIDGKRLCFRTPENVFFDIEMGDSEWLKTLRNSADETII